VGNAFTGGLFHSTYFWLFSVLGSGIRDGLRNLGKNDDGKIVIAELRRLRRIFRRIGVTDPRKLKKGAQEFVALQNSGRLEKIMAKPRKGVQIEKSVLHFHDRLMLLSAASYGWKTLHFLGLGKASMTSNRRGIQLLLGIPDHEVYKFESKSKIFRPGFLVCLDRAFEQIHVTIRGTMRIQDLLTDFSVSPLPFKIGDVQGQVHGGFLRAAENLLLETEPTFLDLLKQNPTFGLTFSGHSLGGAVASLMALSCKQRFPHERNLMVDAVSFAAPPVMSHNLSQLSTTRNTVTSLVLGDDVVPRLSEQNLELFLRICHKLSNCAPKCNQDEKTFLVESLVTEAEMLDSNPLVPGGKTIHITEDLVEEVDSKSFGVIRLSQDVLNLHLPSNYLNALRRIQLNES